MNDPKQIFIEFAGDKYKRFMETLRANEQGKIELRFWQEALLDRMYDQIPDFPVDRDTLLESIRDGTEMLYKCNVRGCWGYVICFERANDLWGCGECGKQWKGQKKLPKSMTGKV